MAKNSYQNLSLELDEVLTALQQPGIQVDDAAKLYERGLKLVDQLEKHLGEAENTIKKLSLQVAERTSKEEL
ncbi:MAG TPA: exodeoxyribonuclease VII small subunit [Candidatus Saccharimonadales bacterium]